MNEDTIVLSHGNGGKNSRELIDNIFRAAFNDSVNEPANDAARILCDHEMMITTDGFTVDPLFFPGGDIGSLSICGTINDLVVSGAIPQYLSCSFFIEEGFSKRKLENIVSSMAKTCKENRIKIVTGDTKILPRGNVSGVYISTTGIGKALRNDFSTSNIKPGDAIYITGSIGDHGAAVMLAREDYGLSSDLLSDCASVLDIGTELIAIPEIKFMRDPTRGGVATVCHEIISSTGLGIKLTEENIPIKKEVLTFCEILGFSPFYLASEGRILFVSEADWKPDEQLLQQYNIHKIGLIEANHDDLLLQTQLGGLRIIPELDDSPLPRIC